MGQFRYLPKKDLLFGYCYLALKNQFESPTALQDWYDALPSDDRRDKFLKVAPYYLALVKNGDWHVDIPDANVVIDYLTETYKFIAIIALIESLSDEKHIDFYTHLMRREIKSIYPLARKEVEALFESYNNEHGANRRCISFFRRLSPARQKELENMLELVDTDDPIDTLVRFLYQVRSNFVHNAEFAHELSRFQTLSSYKGKPVISKITVADVMTLFEEGLLAWCQH